MKARTLSKSGIKDVNNEIFQEYGVEPFNKKDLVIENKDIEKEIIYIQAEGMPMFFYWEENLLVPTLKLLLKDNFLKKITVDMGAVKFVAGGADIMRPGIIDIEDNIHEGEVISIIDEKNKKPLAIGKALYSSKDMENEKKGKSIKSIHYIGDDIWNL